MVVDNRYCRWGGVNPILRNLACYVSNFKRFSNAMYSCIGIVSFVIRIPAHPNVEIRNPKKMKWKPTLKAVTKISLLFFICYFLLLHWKVFNFAPLLLVAFYVKGNPKEHKVYDTRCSQAVPHPSTILARRCLTSVIGRERVYSSWYGRRQSVQLKSSSWSDFAYLSVLRVEFQEIRQCNVFLQWDSFICN